MRAILATTCLAAGLGFAALPAQAQGVHCDGRLAVEPVVMTEVPASREYNEARRTFSVGLRNLTGQAMLVFVRVGQLPGTPLAGSREIELEGNASRRQTVLNLPANTTVTAAQVQGVLQYICR
ncbi:hypothetical protein KTR66_00415 [Roseococcus sp. SDR]|uniref:hypothetical protein n=1 Tax=Roseococcus sp. SDR TaxID=2835532 RepID=UPI001BD1BB52|nr:hypothetical protein [Roseococcus sp. SDR]MBS7788431.1 hypothetical protein [Roseococcus sp. SDR]MBV1843745.1 hypothetical protein [Roseococcus sp. SDR]